ncbi:MAG: ComEC/Rec2 family competence protein [Pyrinomonadaceae bacterium]|nr:ComEC/Rec2 family competence protein [Sphingobacteriaceae bacterium]
MNPIQKGELVFLRVLLAMLPGIVTAVYLPCTLFVYRIVLVCCLSLFVCLWFTIAFYKKYQFYFRRWIPGALVHLLVFFTSIAITLSQSEKLKSSYFANYNSEALVVSVVSEPKLSNDILRFEARVKQGLIHNSFVPQSGLMLIALKITNEGKAYTYGDELLITSNYHEVEPPFNPYEFDYKNFLANRGIHHQAFINESQIRVLKIHQGNSVISYALALRRKMVSKYKEYIHNKEASSIASTLILGYKADLSAEVLSAYSKTGTMHVLSVSGMHVGIVFGVLTWLLGFMNRTKSLRISRALIIISLIVFYALITGFSPSVCRAALMLSIYVLGKAVNRSSNTYNLIATSAVLLLLYNPYFLFDVGCQLSYLAVVGLVYFYPKIYHSFYVRNYIGDKIWSYIALSCAAQLATFPLGLYYFHQFPVYFLISNLFIVLPVVVIMYLGLGFLFIPWQKILEPLGSFLELSIVWMNKGLFFIEHLPFANVLSYNPAFAYYFLIYLIIITTLLAFQTKSKILIYVCLIFCLLFFSYRSSSIILSEKQSGLTFYSLRKNSAIGFFKGRSAVLFSDLDSADKTFSFSVNPSLQARADELKYLSRQEKSNQLVFSEGNFFQFENFKLVIWDKNLNSRLFSKHIKVNAVLLSGRPFVKLKNMLDVLTPEIIIIDGTNPDRAINSWKKEAATLGVKCYVVKKNPAYAVNLN